MTKEEAIAILENEKPCNDKTLKYSDDVLILALDIAIKALKQESCDDAKSETVTEFADRCRECGAKYGKLLKQEPCDKCVYSTKDGYCQYENITETIPPFEPCDDVISREATLEKAVYTETEEGWYGYTVDVDYIKSLPSVKPQEKTGYWRPIYQGDEIIGYRCSECEFGRTNSIYRANYCHNCGARMIEPQESEEI